MDKTVRAILRLHVATSEVVLQAFSTMAQSEGEDLSGEDLQTIDLLSKALGMALVPSVLLSLARMIKDGTWVIDHDPAEQLRGLAMAYMEQVGALIEEQSDALAIYAASTSAPRSDGATAS